MGSTFETTVAVLTPPGRGAIAVVAVEGPCALQSVAKWFRPRRDVPLSEREENAIVYGKWGSDPAEDVVVSRRASDKLEVHCHGGPAAVARIFDDLVSVGAVEQSWPEWVSSKETSALCSAARVALAAAPTRRTAAILLDQYHGALERAVKEIVGCIARGDLAPAMEQIDSLLACSTFGLHLTTRRRIVIAGPPNVGKSSLINALLGYQRAIVFDQPGTTRDLVTASTAFDGWPVELVDTAGLRETDDELEAAGIRRASEQLKLTDARVLVFDLSASWNSECQALVDAWPQATIVHNKSDLIADKPESMQMLLSKRPSGIIVSAAKGTGLEMLIDTLAHEIAPVLPQPNQPVPFEANQYALLQQAKLALRRSDSDEASSALHKLLAGK